MSSWFFLEKGMKRILFHLLITMPMILALASFFNETSVLAESQSSGSASQEVQEYEGIRNFRGLSDKAKIARFNRLSESEKISIFPRLSATERKLIFANLTEEEKLEVFSRLEEGEKVTFFAILGEEEKQGFYSSLEIEDRDLVFRNLRDSDKKLIYESLSEADRLMLMQKYPGLALIIGPAEIPATDIPEEEAELVEEELPPSRLEKIMSGEFPTAISRELRQYGYDFFTKETVSFTPMTNIPVGPDYVIGPGDEFTIHLWGKVEDSYEVTVTRDGYIIVPRIGNLNVSGMTFGELKQFLSRKFKQYYPTFEMNVTMGQLRSIEIFIVGEVHNPGTYSVSSLASVLSALYEAKPSKNGSLRNIKLVRNNKTIRSFDLYRFLIKGLKRDDIRLQTGDTIFVPVIGPVVGVAGNVRRPAIYEMKGLQTIGQVIEMAGGVMPIGHLQSVTVQRLEGNRRRVIKSFNLDPSHDASKERMRLNLKDGDLIKIYPVHEIIRQVVYLEGHVKYPREYELKPQMRLSDLIQSYDDLLPEPYLPRAEIVRLVPPDYHSEVIPFDLGALLAGDKSHNLLLKDLDRIRVYRIDEKRETPEVSIRGAVRAEGNYRLYTGMRVRDLIFQSGNVTNRAFLEKGTISRLIAQPEGTKTEKIDFCPRKALAGDPSDNILLEPDDTLYIRQKPEYEQALHRRAYLEGEFVFSGEYSFSEGETISQLIDRAGGLTTEAYPFGAMLFRESVKELQQQRLDEYISRLEEDILTLGSQAAEQALDKEEAAILAQTLNAKKQLLRKLEGMEATGRMVINLPEVLADAASKYNFELRAGDRLIVKEKPDHVNVLGEVYNPTALLFESDKGVGYYLDLVGGITKDAEEDEIYLVKANGTVLSKSQERGGISWDSEKYRWASSSFYDNKVDPGDTIIVPKELKVYPWLRVAKDITQVLAQVALSAGVLVAAAK
jgi:protein involved in polysaccharide export with SLBB domain